MTVTFFGHRTALKTLQPLLKSVLIDLIEKHNANKFYVGNQGGFDYTVRQALRELKEEYPHIEYNVVLAYIPVKRGEFDTEDYSDTLYPEGLEKVPLRYAIIKRNLWMIEQSDTVVTYVVHTIGGASQFKEIAQKKGKNVINIGENLQNKLPNFSAVYSRVKNGGFYFFVYKNFFIFASVYVIIYNVYLCL
ncbi:MAG: hypothetical protein IJ470_00280 [Clostridia bacterium]|nr:hypothetical protein [Clostridia bacterium]